jgi:hypothetical protein
LGTAIGVANVINTPNICLTRSDGQFFIGGIQIKGMFGSLWTDGQAERVGFTTVLAPNSPGCTDDTNGNADSQNIILPPSSHHPGGVMGGMADGSVRFFSETIDTGNLGVGQPLPTNNNTTQYSGQSNYGVWGALGSKSGSESVAAPN